MAPFLVYAESHSQSLAYLCSVIRTVEFAKHSDSEIVVSDKRISEVVTMPPPIIGVG